LIEQMIGDCKFNIYNKFGLIEQMIGDCKDAVK